MRKIISGLPAALSEVRSIFVPYSSSKGFMLLSQFTVEFERYAW
jgi:hypothetical protein